MIEGWGNLDEQQTAYLVHTDAEDDEPDMRYLVVIESLDGDTIVHNIIGNVADREAASSLLRDEGFNFVNPQTIPF